MNILQQIEAVTDHLTITLTIDADHLLQQRRETALFHRAYEVYRDLQRLFPHLETAVVPEPPPTALTAFQRDFFQVVPAEQSHPVSALSVWECQDKDGEIESIAWEILRQCRKGRRFVIFSSWPGRVKCTIIGWNASFAATGFPVSAIIGDR